MPSSDDTNPETRFPATQWTWIWEAGQPGEQGRAALGSLLDRYLPAMRAHLVFRKHIPRQLVDDLLQDFIARRILEQHLLARVDRTRGSRFRSFLLTALDNFAFNELRREDAARRHAPLAKVDVENQPAVEPPGSSPFDSAWARQVIEAATVLMQAECAKKDRPDIWAVFQCRIVRPMLDGEPPLAYGELVQRFGYRAPVQASMVLATGKRMFRRAMRQVIAQYAASEDEVDSEMAELLEVLVAARAK